MRIFITGTDTNIGKTLVSAWICLHSGYEYFKPIQTGIKTDPSDSSIVRKIASSYIHKENYLFKEPVSPHIAAKDEEIDMSRINVPGSDNLIVEGAGGVLVPINTQYLMVDLILQMHLPVILVAKASLGTINHTLLSLEALRNRNIKILGVVISGGVNKENEEAIENYGKTQILDRLPFIDGITSRALRGVALSDRMKNILGII